MNGKWKKLSSKYVYENPWIKVREDQVIKPDGQPGTYSVIEQGRGACIIPVDKDGKIWMIKSYRYIFNDEHWELVAGDVDEGETREQAARRELIEELHLDADNFVKIGKFRPSNGRMLHETDIFVASGLKPEQSEEKEWDISERKAFSLEDIDHMIKNGEILDGYVMNALYFYKLHLTDSLPHPQPLSDIGEGGRWPGEVTNDAT